jgi:hypothetical protein
MRAHVSTTLARVHARPSARTKRANETRAVDRARASADRTRARDARTRAGASDSVAAGMSSTVGARRALRRECARALGNGCAHVGRASPRAMRAMAASTSTSGGLEDEVRARRGEDARMTFFLANAGRGRRFDASERR